MKNFLPGDKIHISYEFKEANKKEVIEILLQIEKLKQLLLEDLIIQVQLNENNELTYKDWIDAMYPKK